MRRLDALIDRFVHHELAPSSSLLGLRAIHAWLLAYVLTAAPAHAQFWGPLRPSALREFDPARIMDWVTRLSTHPALAPYCLLWPSLLVANSLVGLTGRTPRMSAAVAWFLLAEVDALSWFAVDGGNRLISILLIFSVAMHRPKAGASIHSVAMANTALVLARLQVVVVYLGAAWAKAQSPIWLQGEALQVILLRPAWSDSWIAPWILSHPTIASTLTYATFGFQLAFGPAVLIPRLRLWALAAGLVLHGALAEVTGLVFFSAAMAVGYTFWLPDELSARIVTRVRRTFAVLRRSSS